MQKINELSKNRSFLLMIPAVLIPLGIFAALAGRYDFYFDLNDDYVMQHILSGTYTGVPESRNIQSLYPLTLFLSFLYRMVPDVEWYGIFLLLCQFGALSFVISRLMKLKKTPGYRGLMTGIAVLTAAGLMLYHFVFVQYSVTVGMMMAAACVSIVTADNEKRMLPALLFVMAGYLLRSEMMLFLLPFLLLTLLTKVLLGAAGGETTLRRALLCFLAAAVSLALGAGILRGADRAGYRAADWKEFLSFFDARTQLYDFQGIPSYEGNEAFYESIDLSKEEVQLLFNYNFLLDDKIDAQTMAKTAEYAARLAGMEQSFAGRVKNALWDYRAAMTSESTLPYNAVSAALYAIAAAAVLLRLISASSAGDSRKTPEKHLREALAGEFREALEKGQKDQRAELRTILICLGCLICLFAGRSLLWCYLLYYHRPVVRLLHPMCLMEAVILLWVTAVLLKPGKKLVTAMVPAAVVLGIAAVMQLQMTAQEYDRRISVNEPYRQLMEYYEEHSDDGSFYITDVYSTVDFSEKIFDNSISPGNWDLCGGWTAGSPLQVRKWENYGLGGAREALMDPEKKAYFVSRKEYDMQWLTDYYRVQGTETEIRPVDTAADYFNIYEIRKVNDR